MSILPFSVDNQNIDLFEKNILLIKKNILQLPIRMFVSTNFSRLNDEIFVLLDFVC